MARDKKAKSGSKARSNFFAKKQNQRSVFVTSSRAQSPPSDHVDPTFTLRDAARNSEHLRSFWSSSGLSLRHRSMNFVPSLQASHLDEGPAQASNDLQNESDCLKPQQPTPADLSHGENQGATNDPSPDDGPTYRDVTPPRHQIGLGSTMHSSSSSSVSSEEVVFAGRNNIAQTRKSTKIRAGEEFLARSKTRQSAASDNRHPCHPSGNFEGQEGANVLTDDPETWFGRREDRVTQKQRRADEDQKPRRTRRRRRISAVSSSDGNLKAALDDYAANLRENGEIETLQELNKHGTTLMDENKGWAASERENSEEVGASEEVINGAQQILSKRYRAGKLQYLVVWENRTVDEARWIPGSSLALLGAGDLIKAFEDQEQHFSPHQQQETDSDDTEIDLNWSSNSDFHLADEEEEDSEDDRDLFERRQARMTDEHIARLLQKQEYLGFNSETLQIFDGVEDFEVSEDALFNQSPASSRKKRDQKRRKRQADPWFNTSDELILDGDDYGDFDVMDRERPSLTNNKNRHNDPFLLHLSDPELAQGLHEAWAADRKKKRLKKLEREELRFQGLLGKNNKSKPDLGAKYIGGMSLTQIGEELHRFLFNEKRDSLSLPPMSKNDRKLIHDIANAFGLRSKSKGSDTKRFTVLYKTSRTADFDQATFERLLMQLNRRFLPRSDQKRGAVASRLRRGNAPGQVPGQGGYRDGEVVGAAAPELGVENRGRTMLVKMGWSTGTALGALNNQGILTPIEQVVKNSRAGLG